MTLKARCCVEDYLDALCYAERLYGECRYAECRGAAFFHSFEIDSHRKVQKKKKSFKNFIFLKNLKKKDCRHWGIHKICYDNPVI